MLNASILALDGKGEPPSQAEAQSIRRLRATADDLFQLAMAQMGEMAVMARNGGRGISHVNEALPANLKDGRS